MITLQTRSIWDAEDCALILMDYQEHIMPFINSSDRASIELNARYLTRLAAAFGMPIVLSTVGIKMGVGGPTIAAVREEIPEVLEIDRTSMNSWEDAAFLEAVRATGRRKLVMAGIATEICLAYPVVSALDDGYEVSFIADAVGGVTKYAHDIAVMRMVQAGAVPNTTMAMMSEWFRNWASPRGSIARDIIKDFIADLAKLMPLSKH